MKIYEATGDDDKEEEEEIELCTFT